MNLGFTRDPINVVWFKRDLRTSDHKPLSGAASSGRVIPLYIIEPSFWSLPDMSARHWSFIYDSLIELQQDLESLGAPLIVRIGETLQGLQDIQKQAGQFSLWSHEETGNAWTYQRDLQIQDWCRTQRITWNESATNGVFRRLKSRDQWAAQRDSFMRDKAIQRPTCLSPVLEIKSHSLPSKDDPIFGAKDFLNTQLGGRSQALKVLDTFLTQRGKNYFKSISKPGPAENDCSRLSPHLSFGTLSMREVEHATQKRIAFLEQSGTRDDFFFSKNLKAFFS